MQIKYSPCEGRDAESITAKGDVLTVAGKDFEFDAATLDWPDIAQQTDGSVVEAHRDVGGVLHVTVRRFYRGGDLSWDTGGYHAVNG